VVGLESQSTYAVRYDTTAPELTLTTPTSDVVETGPLVVSGTVLDANTTSIRVNGEEAEVAGEAWRTTILVASSSLHLDVVARDAAGNENSLPTRMLRAVAPSAQLDWAIPEPDAKTVEVGGKTYPTIVRVNGTTIRLRLVREAPRGFLMGSSASSAEAREADERPHIRVIRTAFWLGETEITQRQWMDAMGDNPSAHRRDDWPVDSVRWTDCLAFLGRLNGTVGTRATHFRLPSEAEWEYACRAGAPTPFSIDTSLVQHDAKAPVQGLGTPPNVWGFAEMHGNVWEWCQDAWSEYPGTGSDEPSQGEGPRVLRGGSWRGSLDYCRSANRFFGDPWLKGEDVGFRIARNL
jgi:formylglycine-generating enzyme required for sulfatase activity